VVSSLLTAGKFHSEQSARRAVILDTPSGEVAYVPVISAVNRLLFIDDDIGLKEDFWVNETVAQYYGVTAIYGIPEVLYKKGVRGDFSDEECVEALKDDAVLGDSYASFQLARIYDVGRLGVEPDISEATRYYEEAFRGGEARASRSLFRIYLMDKRTKRDYKKAALYGVNYLFHKYVTQNQR
jgi:TPR repeat protein